MPDGGREHVDSYLLKKFDLQRCLGRGAYGIVWRVVEKETGRIMALKKCFDAFQNSTDAQRTFREIIFLQELNGHENIVRLMNVMKADSNQDLYVLFDHMESDLQNVINASMLTPIHNEYIMYQVLKALKYVHSAGVLHRDLKPSNILLNTNVHVRLCDFGLARTMAPPVARGEAESLLTDYVATRWYRAPELLLGASMYHEGVDMWSIGCILGEMLSGKPILKGRSTVNQLERIVELTGKPSEEDFRPIAQTSSYARTMLESLGNVSRMPTASLLFLSRAPEHARTLTSSCLRFSPEKRPTAEGALDHPFVEKFRGQEAEPTCDKIIRMPIPDTTKMRASDYRTQIYTLIQHRRNSGLGLPLSPGRGAGSKSPRGRRLSNRGKDEQAMEVGPEMPWCHEGGADAPPTTPTVPGRKCKAYSM